MEIKILCACGAKYKFDVEPLHGQMPGPVGCPVCSADGTAAGNAIIAEKLSPAMAPQSAAGFVRPTVVRSSKEHVASPASSAPHQIASPGANAVANVPAVSTGARLGLSVPHTVKPAALEIAVPPPAAATPPRRTREYAGPSDLRGIIGAAL